MIRFASVSGDYRWRVGPEKVLAASRLSRGHPRRAQDDRARGLGRAGLANSMWFGATAVVPALQRDWRLNGSRASPVDQASDAPRREPLGFPDLGLGSP